MKYFDNRTYSVSDFAEWNASGALMLSPHFQRRSVWTTKAKSYLIDTILSGKPMPKVLLSQELRDSRNIRTVVDGQQRLRAILEFINNDFAVMRTHNKQFGGYRFDSLPDDIKQDFWQYEIGVDVLFGVDLPEILDIFARMNTYSVKLNSTELLNAKYLGPFKMMAHELGHGHSAYLLNGRVLTDSQIARMGEVELVGDVLGNILDGISSKKSIPKFYEKYDDEKLYPQVREAADILERSLKLLSGAYPPEDLAHSNIRRIHLFHSTVLAIAALSEGRPYLPAPTTRGEAIRASRLRIALDDISSQFEAYTTKGASSSIPGEWEEFIDGARRATTDEAVRLYRTQFIAKRIANHA